GTSIPTCILVLKKTRQNPNDVLFIDASQHFNKGKTQNVLLDEHITKIITTYKNRKPEDKYSHSANLAMIAENDYNLNIPRYVDTFEAEARIDINAIANEIKTLDQQIGTTDKTIADFCAELGIQTPF
ncbi:N-6 DNA methylase, partial [Flavobacterium sp.]|uniref:N-6 DNA methylase n=1 Tax=Flavobacterium sp. TaxID=239 RepID=UPI0026192D0E